MRNLCGTNWGASINTLLIIYKTLIRSIIEYGSIVYNNISKVNQKKLDSLQYQALKICCAAMTGSSLIALQNETGELPLALNRHRQQLIYYAKVKSNTKHPSQKLIQYPANTKYFDKPNLNLFTMDTAPIFKQQNWIINTNNNPNLTPWLNMKIKTNDTLLHKFKTFHTISNKLNISNTLIESYKNSMHIYTDGTLQQNKTSASGYHIPSLNIISTTRNTDNTPVITAELIAIQQAIEYTVTNTDQSNIAIFTDSIETINRINLDTLRLTIKASQIANNIKQLAATHKDTTIHLIWIPSHIGILGNETIDQHTKTATTKQIQTNSPKDLIDIKQQIDIYITDKWQLQYNTSTKAQTYKTYEPVVNMKIKAIWNIKRAQQRTITRLKLGTCNLNFFKHRNKFHPDGLCPTCNLTETIEHHIIHCTHYNYIAQLQATLNTLHLNPTLYNILTNRTVSIEIAKLIKIRI